MIERRLEPLWLRLQGKKPHMPHFLDEIHLHGIRGLSDLRVGLDYPVSVIAGGNATGKSTVLFAAACAYDVPGAGVRDFRPSSLFPDFRPKRGRHRDGREEVILLLEYSTPRGKRSMQWKRGKAWSKSFLNRKNAAQPTRQVYLRTMSNLSNPSEVRGVLSMSRVSTELEERPLTPSQIRFAHQVLPFRYSEVVQLSSGNKNLLFATQDEGGPEYSELHMAAGERAVLRLSQEIARLNGALVLIDEVEAGLHPWVQQLLMLHIQELALRRDLQVIVTSHSPVVLDSVPPHGRVLLDRDSDGRVTVQPPHRDLVQDALYGRASRVLNCLCEDEAAEAILQGVFDTLLPRLMIRRESVRIGRDTGASEFPTHAAAFRKFGQIDGFVFVLDGDAVGKGIDDKIRMNAGMDVPIVFLPGSEAPEAWVWGVLHRRAGEIGPLLGANTGEFVKWLNHADAVFAAAQASSSEIAKEKLLELSGVLGRDVSQVCRVAGRLEAERPESDIQPMVEALEEVLNRRRAD